MRKKTFKNFFFLTFQFGKNITTCGNSILSEMPVNLFTCKLKLVNQENSKVLDNFKVVSIFDKHFGSYACEIQLLTSMSEVIASLKNLELSFELEVSILLVSWFFNRLSSEKFYIIRLFFSPTFGLFVVVLRKKNLKENSIQIPGTTYQWDIRLIDAENGPSD